MWKCTKREKERKREVSNVNEQEEEERKRNCGDFGEDDNEELLEIFDSEGELWRWGRGRRRRENLLQKFDMSKRRRRRIWREKILKIKEEK